MAAGNFVAYYRVSTQKQGRSGLGLEAQQKAVRDHLNGGEWQLLAELVEVESGKRSDRPKLKKALALCRLKRATLIVAKLDRLARNVAFISALMESGVEFECVDMPQANRLTVHILAAMAEHEAAAISARTKAALAAAKARGKRLGGTRWKITDAVVRKGAAASALVRAQAVRRRAADLKEHIDEIRREYKDRTKAKGETPLREIAAGLNDRGFSTTRGCKWTAAAVQRLLRSAA